MRRTFLIGLGLAVSVAGAEAAQGQDAPRPDTGRAPGDARAEGRRGGPGRLLLRGITLTDSQKTQFVALFDSAQAQFTAKREDMLKQREELRAARERGDTATVRDIMRRGREEMEATREQHFAAMRTILTEEQRAQFDKNLADMKQRLQERDEKSAKRGKKVSRANR